MATEIEPSTSPAMEFKKDVLSPVSQLEAARKAAALDQQRRVEEACARMLDASKQTKAGKRKSIEERVEGHVKAKVQKTTTTTTTAAVVASTTTASVKKELKSDVKITQAVSAVATAASTTTTDENKKVETAPSNDAWNYIAQNKAVADDLNAREKLSSMPSDETSAESFNFSTEQSSDPAQWSGPASNFHIKELGLAKEKVDIYAPVSEQQEKIRHLRERALYCPESAAEAAPAVVDDEEDSEFEPAESSESESDSSDSEVEAEIDEEELQALKEEREDYAKRVAVEQLPSNLVAVQRSTLFFLVPVVLVLLLAILLALLGGSSDQFECNADEDSSFLGCSSLAQAQSAVQDAREALAERVTALWHAVAGGDQ